MSRPSRARELKHRAFAADDGEDLSRPSRARELKLQMWRQHHAFRGRAPRGRVN